MYIDNCVQGTLMIARGDSPEPVNLGSSELVSINTLVEERYGWSPSTSLRDGLGRTYPWIKEQMAALPRASVHR